MNFKPPSKRKKIDSSTSSSPGLAQAEIRDAELNSMRRSTIHGHESLNVNLGIQQARNYAVAQAQQDGCTANYRVFDSPYGNYLVPVTPTRAELGG